MEEKGKELEQEEIICYQAVSTSNPFVQRLETTNQSMQRIITNNWIKACWIQSLALAISISFGELNCLSVSNAYPILAQQNYENPREATGRIVCANCHLAKKPVDIEAPQSVLPDSVFEAVVKIPYDM